MAESTSKPKPSLVVVELPITDVKPYWRNPRKNDKAVAAVRASIERYGFQQPLVIDQAGMIVVGHTRYRAAVELGLTSVPCVRWTGTAAKAKEYRIADNKTNELAEWDLDHLTQELNEIPEVMDLAIFFESEAELKELVDGVEFRNVTGNDVEGAANRLDGHFKGLNEGKLSGLVGVICPHCTREFMVDRGRLENEQATD